MLLRNLVRRATRLPEVSSFSSYMPKPKAKAKVFTVWKSITVEELAKVLQRDIDHIYEGLLYVKGGDKYDHDTSKLDDPDVIKEVVKKLGYKCIIRNPEKPKKEEDKDLDIKPRPVDIKSLKSRPPIVTIMGHVDHGKTTLLDTLRNTNVAAGEAGGITQHIGAFTVKLDTGEQLSFLDTPGHAAFTSLRMRGAQVTDMVVLVVAADDGVMDQTKESIQIIKEAKVPLIVAINKIDRPEANIDRTKKMLIQFGVQLEEFGGEVQCVEISALKNINVNSLVQAILVQASIMELKAEYSGPMEGYVLSSQIHPHRGRLTNLIIKRGLLKKAAYVVSSTSYGKVRGIFDENGEPLSKPVTPSTPVQIIGWRTDTLPSTGDFIQEVASEKIAKEVVQFRTEQEKKLKEKEVFTAIQEKHEAHLREYKQMLDRKRELGIRYKMRRKGPREKEIKEDNRLLLPIIIKGDVDGSVDAFLDVLDTYDQEKNLCELQVVHYGVGDITETDVNLASAFGATIYGFNIKIPPILLSKMKKENVEYYNSNVIYRLIDRVKEDINKTLPPETVIEEYGRAEVLQLFHVSTTTKKKIPVAGSKCISGSLQISSKFKIIRNTSQTEDESEWEVIHDGKISSLRHFKDEVDSVKSGMECGVCISTSPNQKEMLPGDIIICYGFKKVPRKCEWTPW